MRATSLLLSSFTGALLNLYGNGNGSLFHQLIQCRRVCASMLTFLRPMALHLLLVLLR